MYELAADPGILGRLPTVWGDNRGLLEHFRVCGIHLGPNEILAYGKASRVISDVNS